MKRKLLALFVCSLIFFFYLILMVPFRTPGGTPGGTPGILILTMVLWFTWRLIVKKKPGALSSGIEEDKLPVTPFLLLGAAILYGMLLMYAGFIGIEGYAGGAGWAWVAVAVGITTRFTLPLTVGAFYAAHTLWHWHWVLALVFTVPGIALNLLIVPGFLASLFAKENFVDKLPEEVFEDSQPTDNTCSEILAGYELLADEQKKGERHEALWLKCLSEADGDEARAIHAYNRDRAKLLVDKSQTISRRNDSKSHESPRIKLRNAFIIIAVCGVIFAMVPILLNDRKGAEKPTVASENSDIQASALQAPIKTVRDTIKQTSGRDVSLPAKIAAPEKLIEPDRALMPKADDLGEIDTFTNSLGMKFVKVPNTKVLMCIHETRNSDYAIFARSQGSVNLEWQSFSSPGKEQHPVVKVSYDDAIKFCSWLSGVEGKCYLLPTDGEWSAAVGKTKYPWGDYYPPRSDDGNYGISDAGDGYENTSPVMSYKPNNLGIFDLGGNVWEWCLCDSNGADKNRVLRGASWSDVFYEDLLSTAKVELEADFRGEYRGFRIVLLASETMSSNGLSLNPGDKLNKALQAKFDEIFQERLQTARQKGLDIRNAEVLKALARAKFLELHSPQRAILDRATAEFYDYCERKKSTDEAVLARVRKWISDEAWASKQRLEYIQNNPDYKPPVTTDARCEPRFLDSWILHKKDDLLFFWGTPAKVVPKEDGGEFLGYFKDDNFIEVFNTTTDGDIIYWETLVLTE